MSLSPAKKRFVDLASAEYGEGAVLSKSDVKNVREKNNLGWPSWFVRSPYRIGKGEFKLPVEGETVTPVKPLKMKVPAVKKVEEVEESIVAYHNPTENLVPSKDPLYVPFGNYNDDYSIIKSGR